MSEAVKPEPSSNRIVSVRFTDAVPWRGESMGVTQATADADSIVPARLEPDGRAVPIEKGQASAGLLLTRKYHDRIANKPRMERVFVPMALIRGIIYGE
jgi:hypothetical protein